LRSSPSDRPACLPFHSETGTVSRSVCRPRGRVASPAKHDRLTVIATAGQVSSWILAAVKPWSERGIPIDKLTLTNSLPLAKQVRGDRLGLGRAAQSRRSAGLRPRTEAADKIVKSICPYCAVGCGQDVYVRDGEITQIEGDPDSPISRGRLCPKGSASKQLVTSSTRETKVRYRPPHGTEWQELSLDQAMDMIADRMIAARDSGWEAADDQERPLNRTMGFAHLGGATLDNEENYLIKKFFSAAGAVQIENQARI
jgi:formate dehydrogenase major subunit